MADLTDTEGNKPQSTRHQIEDRRQREDWFLLPGPFQSATRHPPSAIVMVRALTCGQRSRKNYRVLTIIPDKKEEMQSMNIKFSIQRNVRGVLVLGLALALVALAGCNKNANTGNSSNSSNSSTSTSSTTKPAGSTPTDALKAYYDAAK